MSLWCLHLCCISLPRTSLNFASWKAIRIAKVAFKSSEVAASGILPLRKQKPEWGNAANAPPLHAALYIGMAPSKT